MTPDNKFNEEPISPIVHNASQSKSIGRLRSHNEANNDMLEVLPFHIILDPTQLSDKMSESTPGYSTPLNNEQIPARL